MTVTKATIFNQFGEIGRWFFADRAAADAAISTLGTMFKRTIGAKLDTVSVPDPPAEPRQPTPDELHRIMCQVNNADAPTPPPEPVQAPPVPSLAAEDLTALADVLKVIASLSAPNVPAPKFNPERN